ncbi:hypothetical protein CALVIDRAFT_568102 [Calocera viscosa TUFC12733]|uniref:Uncharacterized protein n=1 Tax=Calocera viscosa (strain TUFC12733) TaxID=1330018 RepID=A0A167HIE2_CALVF|nr:hypothetical protein CALVIDRAFT_568102 [Calocera viscosa TUFC12733]
MDNIMDDFVPELQPDFQPPSFTSAILNTPEFQYPESDLNLAKGIIYHWKLWSINDILLEGCSDLNLRPTDTEASWVLARYAVPMLALRQIVVRQHVAGNQVYVDPHVMDAVMRFPHYLERLGNRMHMWMFMQPLIPRRSTGMGKNNLKDWDPMESRGIPQQSPFELHRQADCWRRNMSAFESRDQAWRTTFPIVLLPPRASCDPADLTRVNNHASPLPYVVQPLSSHTYDMSGTAPTGQPYTMKQMETYIPEPGEAPIRAPGRSPSPTMIERYRLQRVAEARAAVQGPLSSSPMHISPMPGSSPDQAQPRASSRMEWSPTHTRSSSGGSGMGHQAPGPPPRCTAAAVTSHGRSSLIPEPASEDPALHRGIDSETPSPPPRLPGRRAPQKK